MEFASCSILRPQSFSTISHCTNSHLCAFPKNHLNLGSSPFSLTSPKNSTFPGKCLHFHRFTAFSSLSGADDQNPSPEFAVLLEVDGVLIDAYHLGNRQTFNVAFKKLGLDCANWTEPVYLDLLRKCAGDEEKMLIMYFNRIGWPSSLPTTEKESFVKNVLQKKKIAMDEFLISNSLPLRPGLEEFIDDAYSEGLPVVILTSYSKSGDAISRSIIEKLGHERILKLKIVGDKEVEQSLYGQLVSGGVFSSGVDEELAKEAIKAVSAEKQRIAEEVASMLKLNVDIDTTTSESLQKIIAALRAGAETAGLPVSSCVLIAGSQSGVLGAHRVGMPCVVLRSSWIIIEKLGHERVSKLKNIVGDKKVEHSSYGQLVIGKVFSSGVDEEIAKEAIKAVSAEKQRITEEVASMLKLNVDLDTTPSERLQKIIAALRAGAENAELAVCSCVLIAGSQFGVAGAERVGMPCVVLRSSLTAP